MPWRDGQKDILRIVKIRKPDPNCGAVIPCMVVITGFILIQGTLSCSKDHLCFRRLGEFVAVDIILEKTTVLLGDYLNKASTRAHGLVK